MLLTILNTALSLTTLVVLLWVVHQYIKARRESKLTALLHTKNFEKKMDNLLDGLACHRLQRRRNSAKSWPLSQQGGRPESTLVSPCPWKKSTIWTTTRLESSGEGCAAALYDLGHYVSPVTAGKPAASNGGPRV